jgi:peptide-methionine (S)-S-oxide reductase
MENTGLATFGMGCFWCGQRSLSHVDGVRSTRVGYMGGTTDGPTYEAVCAGETGHFEVVEVRYDAEKLSFRELLEAFWASHNPAAVREGNGDSGSQYGSVIFFHTEEQRVQAEESKRRLQASGRFRGRITTHILPASRFWVAEDQHQCYIDKLDR